MAVDDIGFGDHGGAVGERDWGGMLFGARIPIGRKGNALVDDELGEGVGIFVSGDTEDEAVARLDVFVQAI